MRSTQAALQPLNKKLESIGMLPSRGVYNHEARFAVNKNCMILHQILSFLRHLRKSVQMQMMNQMIAN